MLFDFPIYWRSQDKLLVHGCSDVKEQIRFIQLLGRFLVHLNQVGNVELQVDVVAHVGV